MTELDQALVDLRQSPRDHKSQANYFDLFLNSTFFVPILHVEHVTGADAEVAPCSGSGGGPAQGAQIKMN